MHRINSWRNTRDGEISLIISNRTKGGAHDRYGGFGNRLPKVGIDHLPSNSSELLSKRRGAQNKGEKSKPKGSSSDRPRREIKSLFDAQRKRLGNFCPKIPHRSETNGARLKPLHPPILIRTTTSGRHNLASIQQSVSKPPTSPHNSYLGQKTTTTIYRHLIRTTSDPQF